jgi:hypothetical protein
VGSSRTCGARCHNAKEPDCDCWCAGLFHGESGAAARNAFVEAFGELPTTVDDDNLFWDQALKKALVARTPNPCQPSELVVGEGFVSYEPCAHCGAIHRPVARKIAR